VIEVIQTFLYQEGFRILLDYEPYTLAREISLNLRQFPFEERNDVLLV